MNPSQSRQSPHQGSSDFKGRNSTFNGLAQPNPAENPNTAIKTAIRKE